jgi:tetratricopeptide (TPR) repeat protein
MNVSMQKQFMYLLFMSALNSWASDTAFVEKTRLWFEWGEYQRIISEVPLELEKCATDSLNIQCGQLHIHLGVALFASGQLRESRKEFLAALAIDPIVELDKQYVSPEIYDFFLAARSDYTKELSERAVRDSLLNLQRMEAERKRTVEQQAQARRQKSRIRAGVGVSIGCIVISAIAAGASKYEYEQAQSSYEQFRSAAGAGDLLAYNQYKRLTVRADVLTVIAGVAAVAGTGGSAILFYKTMKRAGHGNSPTLK